MAEGTYYDPLRRRRVAATPEEHVRQWLIGQLRDTFGVPCHLMNSEVEITLDGKRYRCDILIFDRAGKPLAVAECKRPDVELTEAVARQALCYDMALGVSYIILSNGKRTLVFKWDSSGRFVPSAELPVYDKMVCRQ